MVQVVAAVPAQVATGAGGAGLHDDRAVSHVKPSPQSLSVVQNPASVQVPSLQKQPAAQLTSVVQEYPGWLMPPPELVPLPLLGGVGWSCLSLKYNWHPVTRETVATAIARPTEVSSLFMVGSFLWRAQAQTGSIARAIAARGSLAATHSRRRLR